MKNPLSYKKIHFVGIGGASMQALALITKKLGIQVSGTDQKYGDYYSILNKNGIQVNENNGLDYDLLVYSSAVPKTNEEIVNAKKNNIEIVERYVYLGELQKIYNNVIAISGTHGKSTTTYLISKIFLDANKKFTTHIGGNSKEFVGGMIDKGKDYFITEACEYKKSLLSLNPTCGVILNIERDHPDCYPNKESLYETFNKFGNNIRKDGVLVIEEKIKDYIKTDIKTLTVGKSETSDYYYKNLKHHNGKTDFDVYAKDKFLFNIKLDLYGEHNVLNSLAAIAVAKYFNIKNNVIIESLSKLNGVKRRFEKINYVKDFSVIVDYAHHPSEIKATIKTAKEIAKGKLYLCFQPHTYSRTNALFDEFVKCFDGVDELIITKTYKAREKKHKKTSFDLFLAISNRNKHVYYYQDFISIAKHLKERVNKNDLVLIVGAGDIVELAKLLV